MAKDKERKAAFLLYVKQGKTAKECAQLVSVTEKTLGDWVEKYEWKAARTAEQSSSDKLEKDLKSLIHIQVEKRIELHEQMVNMSKADKEEAMRTAASLGDDISKLNKTLSTVQKNNKINLSVYLEVMNRIFNSLQVREPKLYAKLLDFQQDHIHEVAEELG